MVIGSVVDVRAGRVTTVDGGCESQALVEKQ